MTHNQIAFAEHKENIRHNRFTEQESKRHNVQTEGVGWAGVNESVRHNVATENINWYSARNLAGLQAAQSSAAYANANLASEQALTEGSKRKQLEASASYQQQQAYTEGTKRGSLHADTALKQAQESYYQGETGVRAGELSESKRHNLVSERQRRRELDIRTGSAIAEGYKDVAVGTFGTKGMLNGIGSLLPIKK